jgi:hypothetical protein
MLRNIPIHERLHAQFRVETFNLFNRVNLAPPGTYVGSGLGISSGIVLALTAAWIGSRKWAWAALLPVGSVVLFFVLVSVLEPKVDYPVAYVLPILFVLGAYVVLPAVLIMGWVRWARRRQVGRTWPSLAGFSLGTASALLAIGAMVYARAVGAFPFYDPSLLRIYRCGLLLSLAGLVFGAVGLRWSGPVRWYAPAAAVGTLLFWLGAAAGE